MSWEIWSAYIKFAIADKRLLLENKHYTSEELSNEYKTIYYSAIAKIFY